VKCSECRWHTRTEVPVQLIGRSVYTIVYEVCHGMPAVEEVPGDRDGCSLYSRREEDVIKATS